MGEILKLIEEVYYECDGCHYETSKENAVADGDWIHIPKTSETYCQDCWEKI
jgi:hypothetical protein